MKTEQYIVNKNSCDYNILLTYCRLSKNLYNSALYTVRQEYFKNKKYLTGFDVINEFTRSNQIDYKSLPAKVSQQTILMVDKNFKSFFALLKLKQSKKYDNPVKLPKYLKKDDKYVVTFTKQALSFKKNGFISLSKLPNLDSGKKSNPVLIKLSNNINKNNIVQLQLVPRKDHIIISIVYNTEATEKLQDNNRYCSIDLGLNNLATIASNVIKPVIINGKPLKSINQYYNKQVAYFSSKLERNKKWSNRLERLTNKRNRKVKDYLHKASRFVVNHLVSNDINTLVIGHNKEWKQEINIGKKNNQNFVNIPHSYFINMIKYKCSEVGINVITIEESYTSKCSFIDNEPIKKHDEYIGKRIKRGLFQSKHCKIINADVNGSLNILKKAICGLFDYSNRKQIEAIIVSPVKLKIKF